VVSDRGEVLAEASAGELDAAGAPEPPMTLPDGLDRHGIDKALESHGRVVALAGQRVVALDVASAPWTLVFALSDREVLVQAPSPPEIRCRPHAAPASPRACQHARRAALAQALQSGVVPGAVAFGHDHLGHRQPQHRCARAPNMLSAEGLNSTMRPSASVATMAASALSTIADLNASLARSRAAPRAARGTSPSRPAPRLPARAEPRLRGAFVARHRIEVAHHLQRRLDDAAAQQHLPVQEHREQRDRQQPQRAAGGAAPAVALARAGGRRRGRAPS